MVARCHEATWGFRWCGVGFMTRRCSFSSFDVDVTSKTVVVCLNEVTSEEQGGHELTSHLMAPWWCPRGQDFQRSCYIINQFHIRVYKPVPMPKLVQNTIPICGWVGYRNETIILCRRVFFEKNHVKDSYCTNQLEIVWCGGNLVSELKSENFFSRWFLTYSEHIFHHWLGMCLLIWVVCYLCASCKCTKWKFMCWTCLQHQLRL